MDAVNGTRQNYDQWYKNIKFNLHNSNCALIITTYDDCNVSEAYHLNAEKNDVILRDFSFQTFYEALNTDMHTHSSV